MVQIEGVEAERRFKVTPDGKFRETSVGAYLTDEQNSTGFAGDQEIPHRPRVGGSMTGS